MGVYNTEKNAVKEYIDWLQDRIGKENIEALASGKLSGLDDNAPFLSVVMRTQGKRIEMLREAVLCLWTQTCQDFEVLIMGHNLDGEARIALKQMIADFGEDFGAKIRLVEVTGGTRTTPLNRGFEEARGIYVSFFDDDDLVFDNWVESFYELYLKNPGKILHAYSVAQDWHMKKTGLGEIPVSMSGHKNIYCVNFDTVEQFSVNRCPIMSLAFPSYIFRSLGFRFDETLTTTEDWDFLMRTALICGVCDTVNVTSIYRHWKNNQNSQSLHNAKEWEKNYKTIQNRLVKEYYAGKVSSFDRFIPSVVDNVIKPFNRTEVFIDSGKGFAQNKIAELSYEYTDNRWDAMVKEPKNYGSVRKVRIDPDDYGVVILENLDVTVISDEGEKIGASVDFLRSNYVKVRDSYVFLGADPQVIFNLEKECECNELVFHFNLKQNVSVRVLYIAAAKFLFFNTLRKCCRFGYRAVSRLLNK